VEPVLELRPEVQLQFGHGGGAVEDHEDPLRRHPGLETSIRPRRWSRGGLFGRASVNVPGEDFNSATAVEPWRTTRGRASVNVPGEDFNSATAVEPWRTARVRSAD